MAKPREGGLAPGGEAQRPSEPHPPEARFGEPGLAGGAWVVLVCLCHSSCTGPHSLLRSSDCYYLHFAHLHVLNVL